MALEGEKAGSTRVAGLTAPAPVAPSINYNQPKYIGSGVSPSQTSVNYNQPAYIGSGVGPAPAPSVNYNQPKYIGSGIGPASAPIQQSAAASAPAPAPVAPVGGAQWYGGLDQAGKAAQDQSWLGGDSDYTAQIGEYDRALQTFIDRIVNQKKGYEQDATDATNSTNRNQTMSLDQMGEDFGARGLSYSGLAVDSADKTNQRFNEAKGQIGKVLSRNNQDADNRQADYQAENQISRGNAERSSLSRQAQRQALLDSMAGF